MDQHSNRRQDTTERDREAESGTSTNGMVEATPVQAHAVVDAEVEIRPRCNRLVLLLGLVTVVSVAVVMGVTLSGGGESPTDSPDSTPIEIAPTVSFMTTEELREAVIVYLTKPEEHDSLGAKYGYPIGKWDVSRIQDFSRLFSGEKTKGAAYSFNEDISAWVSWG